MRSLSVWPSRSSIAIKGLAVLLVNVVDHADVGMIQSGYGLALPPEALEGLVICGQRLGQELERDELAELAALGLLEEIRKARVGAQGKTGNASWLRTTLSSQGSTPVAIMRTGSDT